MRIIQALIFLITCLCSNAQLLDNSSGIALEDEWKFNEVFIKNNSICEVEVTWSVKKDGYGIEKTGESSVYRFDGSTGKLVSREKVISLFGNPDTIYTHLTYVEGLLDNKAEKSKRSLVTYEYVVQDSMELTINRYKQDVSKDSRKTLINSETVSTSYPNDTTTIQLSRNDIGLAYHRQTRIYNSFGMLLQDKSEFIIGGDKTLTSYTYNAYGRVAKKSVDGRSGSETYQFFYDDLGSLQAIIEDSQGEIVRSEFLYSENGILEAILRRDEKRKRIIISQISVGYCE